MTPSVVASIFCVSIFLSLAWAARMIDDTGRPIDLDFRLFAYGDGGIDGMRVFAADGLLEFGNISQSDASNKSDFMVRILQESHKFGPWAVYAEGEQDRNTVTPRSAFVKDDAASSQVVLALKETEDMTKPVLFTTNDVPTGIPTDIWWLYGKYIEVGLEATGFYGRRIENGQDVWQLMWSQTVMSSVDHVPITLRSIGPASATSMHD